MPRGAWIVSSQGVPKMTLPTVWGPSAQLGAALAVVALQAKRATPASRLEQALVTRAIGISLQHRGYPDDSGVQRDLAGKLRGGELEPVLGRLQPRTLPVPPLQGQGDQAVGKPGVLRQQRPVQVGADQVEPANALEAVAAVVPKPLEDAAERLGLGAEVRPAAVVLEAGQDLGPVAKVDLDRDVADQPRTRHAHGLQVDQAEPRQAILAEPVAVAEQLVAPADREHGGAVLDGRRHCLPLALDHVGGNGDLVAVLPATEVDEVVGAGIEALAGPGAGVDEADATPLAAA